MAKRILGSPGEPHLIDEFGREQLLNVRIDPSAASRSRLNRDPMTAAAPSVCLAAGPRRSMRAAMVACSVAGTLDLGDIGRRHRSRRARRAARRVRPVHARSPRRRTGFRRHARRFSWPIRADRRIRAQQLGDQRRGFRIAQRRKGNRLSAGDTASAPWYSGR